MLNKTTSPSPSWWPTQGAPSLFGHHCEHCSHGLWMSPDVLLCAQLVWLGYQGRRGRKSQKNGIPCREAGDAQEEGGRGVQMGKYDKTVMRYSNPSPTFLPSQAMDSPHYAPLFPITLIYHLGGCRVSWIRDMMSWKINPPKKEKFPTQPACSSISTTAAQLLNQMQGQRGTCRDQGRGGSRGAWLSCFPVKQLPPVRHTKA